MAITRVLKNTTMMMMKVNNEKRKKRKLHKWNIFENKENHNLINDTLKFDQNQNQVFFSHVRNQIATEHQKLKKQTAEGYK